jgi:hypothetical protein
MNVKIKYGIDEFDKHTLSDSFTIGQLIRDDETRAYLGYGDNVRALINGVEQPESAIVPDGATVVIETRANSKAVQAATDEMMDSLEETICKINELVGLIRQSA